jgi:hypothetical protein
MSIEVPSDIQEGQYWKHTNQAVGVTVWKIVEVTSTKACRMTLLVDLTVEREGDLKMEIGDTRDYPLDSFCTGLYWGLIELDDLPLHLLGAL